MEKLKLLEEIFGQITSVIVAFSGGVDSTFLAKVAHDVLGEKAIAATANSLSLARSELEDCKKFATQIGIEHRIVQTSEINNINYLRNPPDRCYFCKSALYKILSELAKQMGIETVVNGLNYDDLGEYRAGNKAAEEFGVRSPLVEAKLTKEEIRKYSAQLCLQTHDKPTMPCLASRIPTNVLITPEKLKQVEQAEMYLRTEFKLYNLRVRHLGETARIESDKKDCITLETCREKIAERMKEIGFEKVEIAEYKRGGMVKLPVAR